MSFYADNNRIRILDDTETVFDTENNMPHIVGTAYVTDVGVTFSNIPTQETYYYFIQVCPPQFFFCTTSNPPCSTTPFYCPPPPVVFCPLGTYCAPPFSLPCPPPVQFCPQPVQTCTPNIVICTNVPQFAPQYIAREYVNDQVVVDLPQDEDGNLMSIDFIVIQASGSRTVSGQDRRLERSFLTAVPPGTFSFQGSMILESSLRDDGTSWFKRIMSLFVNNTTKKLMLRAQETVGARNLTDPTRFDGSGYPLEFSPGNEASTFNFNLKVFFGRFKS